MPHGGVLKQPLVDIEPIGFECQALGSQPEVYLLSSFFAHNEPRSTVPFPRNSNRASFARFESGIANRNTVHTIRAENKIVSDHLCWTPDIWPDI